ITVTCDDPDNPNNDRFCDQRKTSIPLRTQLKLAGTYPLTWGGVQIGASLQSYPGAVIGTSSTASGTTWSLSPTTRYAANCVGPCTPNALVFPTLTEASLLVPLVPYGTEFLDRLNQLDVRGSKAFTFGR